jgi:hypothetical protein
LLHQFFAADQLAPLGRPRDLPETVAAE